MKTPNPIFQTFAVRQAGSSSPLRNHAGWRRLLRGWSDGVTCVRTPPDRLVRIYVDLVAPPCGRRTRFIAAAVDRRVRVGSKTVFEGVGRTGFEFEGVKRAVVVDQGERTLREIPGQNR